MSDRHWPELKDGAVIQRLFVSSRVDVQEKMKEKGLDLTPLERYKDPQLTQSVGQREWFKSLDSSTSFTEVVMSSTEKRPLTCAISSSAVKSPRIE